MSHFCIYLHSALEIISDGLYNVYSKSKPSVAKHGIINYFSAAKINSCRRDTFI